MQCVGTDDIDAHLAPADVLGFRALARRSRFGDHAAGFQHVERLFEVKALQRLAQPVRIEQVQPPARIVRLPPSRAIADISSTNHEGAVCTTISHSRRVIG